MPPPAVYHSVPPAPPQPPRKSGGTSPTVWIVLACVGIVVIALAVALPLIFLRGGGNGDGPGIASSTTTAVLTSSTTGPETGSTEPPTESTEPPTTTTGRPASDIPGDSAGTWAEVNVSGIEQSVYEVAVSDDALIFVTSSELGQDGIYAYLFESGQTVPLPTSGDTAGAPDIDGTLVVWWEGSGGDTITEAHIYAYRLPDGPRVEVASGADVRYPQVAGQTVTWVESRPWATDPNEWQEFVVKGATVDQSGQPIGSAITLVEPGSAVASTMGDAGWAYSLSEGYLAWEQQTEAGAIPRGTWVMDLGQLAPSLVDGDAWRPSIGGNRVVFTLDVEGVSYIDLNGAGGVLDGAGDFATAAPTYAAYFRPTPKGDGTTWAVMAKGYSGGHEQVLVADAGDPPWFLPPIAASAHRVAVALNGNLRFFTWQE